MSITTAAITAAIANTTRPPKKAEDIAPMLITNGAVNAPNIAPIVTII